MYAVSNLSFTAVLGSFIIGIVFTTIGLLFTTNTLLKREIVLIGKFKVIVREKISNFKPYRFSYFHALFYTLLFGPATFIIGIIALFVFFTTIFI